MIRTRISGENLPDVKGEQNYVAVNGPDGAATKTIMDRRETNRRTEDYFWLERLGELSGQALMVFDKSLNLEYCNALTNDLFGLSDADFERLTCYDDLIEYCVARGDFGEGSETTLKALTEDLITNARLQAPKQTADWKITTPAGKHLSFSQGYGRDGRMLVTIRDITDRVVTERALDIAMNVGSAGYWVFNFETKSWKTSFKNFEQLMGAERIRQAETGNFSCLMHPDDRQHCEDAWNDAIKSKESWDLQTRIVDASGNAFHLKFNGVPQISDTGRITSMFCYFVNVTKEVEAQEKQRQILDKAQKALKAKNDILARLSHDVRTPMNAVIGISDALLHHHPDPVTKPKLELIQNSAEKIIRIVDGTLDHSKMEEEKVSLVPVPTDPKACVEMVCRLWEDQAKKNNTKLTYSFDPSLPSTIMMDGFRYEQCLNNLLSNAVKFTQGGQVHVVLTTISKPGAPARLVLAVKDNGIGMTPKQQSQIFEPYTQADESISSRFGGTGLGMTITKQIAELMGGSIKVKSAEGEGTVFIIAIPFKECSASAPKPSGTKKASNVENSQRQVDLPRPKAPAATPQAPKEPETVKAVEPQEQNTSVAPDIMPEQTSPATSGSLISDMLAASPQKQGNTEDNTPYSNLRLLVVDDNATNHMVVSSLLGSVVGSIVTASDGQEAIDQLDSQAFDVVLMDIHMPVMDGIEATLSIRGSKKPYADIPIIALTADPQYQQKRLCRNIGMDEALAKPVKLTELLNAFETISPKLSANSETQNVIQQTG
ncbi:ATP-binding protein [Litorimonas haliclonae]|uniref:PAS domain-containing hybrid sensor histidine kinase/response regulator n=1 Tax=Litorimonas haliclonae TaxID=2081977 RepID=UPI0039EF3F02